MDGPIDHRDCLIIHLVTALTTEMIKSMKVGEVVDINARTYARFAALAEQTAEGLMEIAG